MNRPCPLCGSGEQRVSVSIPPRQFIARNRHCNPEVVAGWGEDMDFPLPLCRCLKCRFVFAGRLPEPDFLDRLYACDPRDDAHASLRLDWTAHLASVAARLFRAAALLGDGPKSILDFGCGHGTLVRLLNAPGGEIHSVGFENDSSSLQFLKRKGIPVLETWEDCKANGPFDVICLNEVLEHVPDPRALLRGLLEMTKPGGLIFLAVPSMPDYHLRRQIRAIRRGGAFDPAINLWEHLNYFSGISLDKMARSEGWVPMEGPWSQDLGFRPDLRGAALLRNLLQAGRAAAEAILFSNPRVTARFFQKPPGLSV